MRNHPALSPAQSRPGPFRRHINVLVFTVPVLLPVCWLLKPVLPGGFSWIPLMVLYLALPVVDRLFGRDQQFEHSPSRLWTNGLPLVLAAVHFSVLAWSLSAGSQLSGLAWWGWVVSQGAISGIVAINLAHEMIHRRQTWAQQLGLALLASVNYVGFRIEHLRWHHIHVATPNDPSSARRGDNLFRFVPRALIRNTLKAWQLQANLLTRRNRRWLSIQNELLWWQLAVLVGAGVIFACLGWKAVVVFLLQGLIAAATLEMINYIEHYGLRRQRLANGRFEPPQPKHSWNADFLLSNALLLQLQRHSDHHANPTRSFPQLRSRDDAPQLPMGYAGMILLATVPPLWRRVMDPRIPSEMK